MKRIIPLLICLLCIYFCAIPVYAHPGGTDSKGGHTNHSTGEYHYHHGYSAHSHYDMDGDGDLDCPYNFVDKTDNSSSYNNSAKGSTTAKSSSQSTTTKSSSQSTTTSTSEQKQEEPTMPIWLFIVLLIIIFFLLVGRNKKATEAIERAEKAESELVREQKKSENLLKLKQEKYDHDIAVLENRLTAQKKHIDTQLRFKSEYMDALIKDNDSIRTKLHSVISVVSEGEPYFPQSPSSESVVYTVAIPPDVYFDENKIPITGTPDSLHPYGDFTVFVSKRSNIYHSALYCGNSLSATPAHIFDVIDTKRPCTRCGKYYGPSQPEWYAQVKRINSYIGSIREDSHKNAMPSVDNQDESIREQKSFFDDPTIKVNYRN